MSKVTDMNEELWPLMELPSVIQPFCCVCGKTWPLNQHHTPWRSQGQLVIDGVVQAKPTITLCGSGNTSGCHGLAHSNMLHFRNHNGRREYLLCETPTKYYKALEMKGWKKTCEETLWI